VFGVKIASSPRRRSLGCRCARRSTRFQSLNRGGGHRREPSHRPIRSAPQPRSESGAPSPLGPILGATATGCPIDSFTARTNSIGPAPFVGLGGNLERSLLVDASTVKKIGFLNFGHWTASPASKVRTAADSLQQSVELAVAAEELGADGAYFRVHHFARQLASPFPLLAAIGAKTSRIEIGTGVIDMRYLCGSVCQGPSGVGLRAAGVGQGGAPGAKRGRTTLTNPSAGADSVWAGGRRRGGALRYLGARRT